MITLRFINIENIIEFDERYINIIEIYDKELFKRITYLINKFSNNIEYGHDIILLEGENRFDVCKNVMVINDFFNININSNKIIKELHKDIEMNYNYEYGDENLLLNTKSIFENLQNVLSIYDFDLDYKREIRICDLLKCIGLKFNEYNYDNPFDNIICLFDLVSNFKICKVLVFINVKCFFNEKEIVELYKNALHRNIKLLLIEHSLESKLLKYENKLYIDKEFDEFRFKF